MQNATIHTGFVAAGFVLLVLQIGCAPPPEPVATDDAYDTAVMRTADGNDDHALDALCVALEQEPDAYQRALLDPAFAALRDSDEFREAMHDAAVQHAISQLTLAPHHEPGEWITVEGRVIDENEDAVVGAVIKVFATDEQGLYHPEIEGEGTPRIFGTLVSDTDGRFMFRTVRPGPYPGTRNARHIHISARNGDMRLAAPHYAVFDDDPLLAEPQNAEQRGEAIRILMNEDGDPSRGRVVLPMR